MKTKSMKQSREFWTDWSGEMAFWGGVSTGPTRNSQMFPSHAAMDGTIRQILGKMAIQWVTHEVRLLGMSHRLPVTTNDLKSFQSAPLTKGRLSVPSPIANVGSRHTQRTTVYLRNVHIAVRSSFVLTPKAGPGDTVVKFEEMFLRRAEKGQYANRPYFGTEECGAEYELITDPSKIPAPLDITEDFGICYFDTDWVDPTCPMYFAPMRVQHGVILYPTWDEVRKLGIAKHGVRRPS